MTCRLCSTEGLCAVGIIVVSGMSDQASTVYAQDLVAPEWRPMMSGALAWAVGLGTSLLAFGGGRSSPD